MLNIFKKKDPIEEFWNWFAANRSEFEDMPMSSTNDSVLERLRKIQVELERFSDGILAEIAKAPDGKLDLILTAEGDRSKFATIEEIIDRAPAIDGWKFTAFRQRIGPGFAMRMKGYVFDPEKMFFEAYQDGLELDLVVYSEGVLGVEEDELFHFGIVLMDNLLGEYDAVTKVRYYYFRDLSLAEDDSGLFPLTELPEFIDDFYSRNNN